MPERWFQKAFLCSDTATGIDITTSTDVACHLWARVSPMPPRIHFDPVRRRGVAFRLMPRYCFTVFWDIEQEEVGDTLAHTFIVTEWPECSFIWWYTYGQIATVNSPSESPWLMCFRARDTVTADFIPDTHPGVTSFDGVITSARDPTSWAAVRAGQNIFCRDDFTNFTVRFESFVAPNEWSALRRGILLFDTTTIHKDAVIQSASLKLAGQSKKDDLNALPSFNITPCIPKYVNESDPTDWFTMTDELLSDTILYADFSTIEWNVFNFNELGLAHIKANKPTGIAVREAKYDIANVEPPWLNLKGSGFLFKSREFGPLSIPTLTVTYQRPCP